MYPMFEEYPISKLLYESQCHICDSHLEWFAYFDADGTSYEAECCGKRYYAVTTKLRITGIDVIEEEEL